jgi:glycine dehydrogenase subunit 1
MNNYIPHTSKERDKMLAALGHSQIKELFSVIPDVCRTAGIPGLPAPLSEPALRRLSEEIAGQNDITEPLFIGAGLYDHYVPAAVDALCALPEFVTAYTPYQPEVSQGTLTGIFEFQTGMCRLTGLDVSNASMYDAATAACEAMLMAAAVTKHRKVVVTAATHPHIRGTLETYARFNGLEVAVAGCGFHAAPLTPAGGDGTPPLRDAACLIMQSPNFYGVIEPMRELAAAAAEAGAVSIAVCDPLSLALVENPGECGADIAVGDCQPLGSPISFGGPHAGYFCAKEKFLRRMPGRIAGETIESNGGKRGFVLTLQAREQHIRREKATSNICSNAALSALRAAVYLALLGPQGLREVAASCARKAAYLRARLEEIGVKPLFDAPYFREFAVNAVLPGAYPIPGGSLVAVTEKRTKEEIDAFVRRCAG